jgi:hypothetical protein
MIRGIFLTFIAACLLHGDLAEVSAEANPERRSDLALTHAEQEIEAAKKAYDASDFAGFRASIEEVAKLAEISQESLESTGKRARKSPKYFKRAEQKLRVLMRRVDSLEKAVALDDRDLVAGVRKRVAATHDRILNDIMTKK